MSARAKAYARRVLRREIRVEDVPQSLRAEVAELVDGIHTSESRKEDEE